MTEDTALSTSPPSASAEKSRVPSFKRLKRKLGKDTTYEDLLEGWTQCCYLLPVKNRLCNIARTPGSKYCGNHLHLAKQQQGEEVDAAELRVPCPLDPTHYVYQRNLEAHLKICHIARHNEELKALPYYEENCNCASGEEVEASADSKLAVDLEQLVDKVHQMFAHIEMKTLDSSHTQAAHPVDALIKEALAADQTSFKQTRHVEQDIAIVHKLMEKDLLFPSSVSGKSSTSHQDDVFLEFGAGKGLLGYATQVADPASFLALIERSGNRKKVDKLLQDRGARFHRVRMDIRHCNNSKLPCMINNTGENKSSSTVTVIAKHLCGVASDFAIRSLANLEASSTSRRRGLGIATCCHHACNYHNYTGQSWLSKFNVSCAEFDILKSWSGWATLDKTSEIRKPTDKNTEEQEEDVVKEHDVPTTNDAFRPKSISYEEMNAIGKKVKRVLDYGRVLYLRNELHMNAELVQYCNPELSPECFMILASEN